MVCPRGITFEFGSKAKLPRARTYGFGAATRDIDFAYLRPGQRLTHRIEQYIDQERDKVAYDLEFTSCVEAADWLDRPDVPRVPQRDR